MKRAIKIMFVFVWLLGLTITISNIVSVGLKAGGEGNGSCVYVNGTFRCMGDGNECDTDSDCSGDIGPIY